MPSDPSCRPSPKFPFFFVFKLYRFTICKKKTWHTKTHTQNPTQVSVSQAEFEFDTHNTTIVMAVFGGRQ